MTSVLEVMLDLTRNSMLSWELLPELTCTFPYESRPQIAYGIELRH